MANHANTRTTQLYNRRAEEVMLDGGEDISLGSRETATMDEADQYALALRTHLAEPRALWVILQELIGRYAESFDDPDAALRNLSERVIFRLDRKDDDALAKGLELPLATVKEAVAGFFSELAVRLSAGELWNCMAWMRRFQMAC